MPKRVNADKISTKKEVCITMLKFSNLFLAKKVLKPKLTPKYAEKQHVSFQSANSTQFNQASREQRNFTSHYT